MAHPPRSIDPEAMRAARTAYEDEHEAVEVIAERLGLSAKALSSRIYRLAWTRKPQPVQAPGKTAKSPGKTMPRSSAGMTRSKRARAKKPGDRITLVRRVRGAVEKEIASAEKLLAQSPSGNPEVERAARALASLVRTLRELNALEGSPPTDTPQDGESQRDLDEFRRDLAARLDRLRAEREQPSAGEPVGEADRDTGD